MPDVDLKEQIRQLVSLQEIDLQIYALRREKESIPLKLKELEDDFARKKENLVQLEKKAEELLKQRKEQELELASKEEEVRKMQSQLYQLKTNKEYSAKLKEIGGVKADCSVLEDKILVLLDESDRLKSQITEEKQFLAEEEKKTNAEKQKVNERGKEIEERLRQLLAQREQVAKQINPKILSKYERILVNRGYLAIVKVKDGACQGCFMQVSPQVINLIKMYNDLVVCEVCQRILYIDEELY